VAHKFKHLSRSVRNLQAACSNYELEEICRWAGRLTLALNRAGVQFRQALPMRSNTSYNLWLLRAPSMPVPIG